MSLLDAIPRPCCSQGRFGIYVIGLAKMPAAHPFNTVFRHQRYGTGAGARKTGDAPLALPGPAGQAPDESAAEKR
ncbi:hypothetical protein [Burkholderia orbicola]|uniref:hypothetical protein n=1 Tax=Burkholderia orbicola TaxID=2978683 RepID=UPI0039A612E2